MSRKSVRKILIVVVVVLAIYSLIGFVVAPLIVKPILRDKISEALDRDVEVRKVSMNPYSLSLRVRELAIIDRDDESLVSFDDIYVNFQTVSAFKKALVFKKIRIVDPFVRIVLNTDGSYNFSDILEASESGGSKDKEEVEAGNKEASSIGVFIRQLTIDGGRVYYVDKSRDISFNTHLRQFSLTVDNFTMQADGESTYRISSRTESGEQFDFEGAFSINPLASKGSLELKRILLKKYAPYYRDYVGFDIASGRLDVFCDYQYRAGAGGLDMKILVKLIGLDSLSLKDPGINAQFLSVPKFAVINTLIDLGQRNIEIESIETDSGSLSLIRREDGSINLVKLMEPLQDEPETAAEKEPPDDEDIVRQAEEAKSQTGPPWRILLKQALLNDYKLNFEDHATMDPVLISLDNINLGVESLAFPGRSESGNVNLALSYNENGRVEVKGSLSLDPIASELALSLKDLDVKSVQSYFNDKVEIYVTDGLFETSGTFSLTLPPDSDVKLNYTGEASISDFASVDKKMADDFLKWKSLRFSGIKVDYKPAQVQVDRILMEDLYSSLIVNPDGSVNLVNVIASEAAPETPPEEALPEEEGKSEEAGEQPFTLAIKDILFKGGEINFSDLQIQPNFITSINNLEGAIKGLSSMSETFAEVTLKGKQQNSAPLEISGKINPLAEKIYIDLDFSFFDIGMNQFTPYSSKYVGRKIEKGKLNLDLSYEIKEEKLNGQNKVLLDQFTLGDKVDSPDAVSLPLDLALALLKDRQGQINIDLPVKGDLSDPKFKFGKIIYSAVINLFEKVATSPFALLGAAFGAGEELSYVDFDYGSFEINEDQIPKLDTLITALYERPQLKLEIKPAADPENDLFALKQKRLEETLIAQKRAEMAKKGASAEQLEQLKIDPSEFDAYLKTAFDVSDFPKPVDEKGNPIEPDTGQMRQMLLDNIQVTEDDLRQLGQQRAEKVYGYILSDGRIESARIFKVEPETKAAEEKEMEQNRVNFALK